MYYSFSILWECEILCEKNKTEGKPIGFSFQASMEAHGKMIDPS